MTKYTIGEMSKKVKHQEMQHSRLDNCSGKMSAEYQRNFLAKQNPVNLDKNLPAANKWNSVQ